MKIQIDTHAGKEIIYGKKRRPVAYAGKFMILRKKQYTGKTGLSICKIINHANPLIQ